ncbi:hypothetical protein MMPV_002467 [Pyropia vietnamensis]
MVLAAAPVVAPGVAGDRTAAGAAANGLAATVGKTVPVGDATTRVDATALAHVAGGDGTAAVVATALAVGAYHDATSSLGTNGSAGTGDGKPPPGADADVAARDGGAVELPSVPPGDPAASTTVVDAPVVPVGDLARGDAAAKLRSVALDDTGVNTSATDASTLGVVDLRADDHETSVAAADASAVRSSTLIADGPATGLPIVNLDDAKSSASMVDAPSAHASNMTTDSTSADLPSVDPGTTATSTVSVSNVPLGDPGRDAGATDLSSAILDDSARDAGAEIWSSVPLGNPAREAGAAPADAPAVSPIEATRGVGEVSASVTGPLPVDEVAASATAPADGVMDGPEVARANQTAGGRTDVAPVTAPVAPHDLDRGEDAVTAAVPSPVAAVPRIIVAAFSADRTSLELLVDSANTTEAATAVCRMVAYAADGMEGTPLLLRSSPRVDAASVAATGSVAAVTCGPLPAGVVQAVVSWSADGVRGWSGSRMVVPPVSVQAAAATKTPPENSGGDVTVAGAVAGNDPVAVQQPPVGPTALVPDGGVDETVAEGAAAVASMHPRAGGPDGAAVVDGSTNDSPTDVTATDGATAGVEVGAAADAADDPIVAHPFDPADTYEASSTATWAPVPPVAAAPTSAELTAAAATAAQAAMAAYAVPSVEHVTGGQEGWPDAALADAAAASRAASAARPSAPVVPSVVGSHSRVPLFVLLAVAGGLYASLRRMRVRRGVLPAWAAGWGGGGAPPRRFQSTAIAGLTHAVASAAVTASGLLGLVSPASAEAGGGGRRGGSPLNGDGAGGGRGGGGGPLTMATPATAAADEEEVPPAATGGVAAENGDSWDNSWEADIDDQPDRREEPWSSTTWAVGATTVVGRRSKERAD